MFLSAFKPVLDNTCLFLILFKVSEYSLDLSFSRMELLALKFKIYWTYVT